MRFAFFIFSIFFLASCTMAQDSKTVELAVIGTEYGDMTVYLYKETPKHRENFLKLAREGFYDGTTFHRVIEGFMIQGGDPNSKDDDPTNDGQGGPGYNLPAEFVDGLLHRKGALSAARLGDQQNPERESSGSQFYVVQGTTMSEQQMMQMALQQYAQVYLQKPEAQWIRDLDQAKLQQLQREDPDSIQRLNQKINQEIMAAYQKDEEYQAFTPKQMEIYSTEGGAPHLDGQYTVFGQVIDGLEVIDKIAVVETSQNPPDHPKEDIPMTVKVIEVDASDLEEKYGFTPPSLN